VTEARSVVLLDVDGVLNALGNDLPPGKWSHGWATADGVSWPISWAPRVVDALRSWHEDGQLELKWLTTWGHDGNADLRRLLGLPELRVAGTYQDGRLRGVPTASSGSSHAAVTPASPDPLSGLSWKYDVVCHLLADHPGRVIWVDDELHGPDSPFRAWATLHDRLVVIGPDPSCGLTEHDLDAIGAIL